MTAAVLPLHYFALVGAAEAGCLVEGLEELAGAADWALRFA